jgi:DNA-binding winged helix-turn-helix (wHTH) protein/TolB-like protein
MAGVADRFRFGEFVFDPGSRELRRDGEEGAQRLPPQPAELLHMLLARDGAIVTRDEIRARLWPDTHVEFDTSLHFCVRQVRAALRDSGSEPRYVQNLPRRGYRLAGGVTRLSDASARPGALAPPGRRWRPGRLVLIASVALVIAAAAWYYGAGRTRATPVRIAIMPFESPAAESALEILSTIAGDTVEIVGPTTTSAYRGSADDLRRLAADYRIDFVLNGRSLTRDTAPYLLAELIRASDGAHVWVRPFGDLNDRRGVGLEIGRQVATALALP